MINILRGRRSIRRYEKRPLDDESLAMLKEALLRSPSSRGLNPWSFVFVDDRGLLEGLSRAKEHGSDFVRDAALAVVVCGDETVSDVWIEDCSIASLIAHLTAHTLGLGSCWIQIRNRPHKGNVTAEEYVRNLLGVPPQVRVEAIIAIGYPGETKKPVPSERLNYGKIKYNGYR